MLRVMLLAFAFVAIQVQSLRAETCIASVYSTHDRDQNGTRTASGIPLNDGKPTIAHKSRPLRSYVKVTNTRTGASGSFMITDRGPYVGGRCVDLSRAAARQIGISGLGHVKVE